MNKEVKQYIESLYPAKGKSIIQDTIYSAIMSKKDIESQLDKCENYNSKGVCMELAFKDYILDTKPLLNPNGVFLNFMVYLYIFAQMYIMSEIHKLFNGITFISAGMFQVLLLLICLALFAMHSISFLVFMRTAIFAKTKFNDERLDELCDLKRTKAQIVKYLVYLSVALLSAWTLYLGYGFGEVTTLLFVLISIALCVTSTTALSILLLFVKFTMLKYYLGYDDNKEVVPVDK